VLINGCGRDAATAFAGCGHAWRIGLGSFVPNCGLMRRSKVANCRAILFDLVPNQIVPVGGDNRECPDPLTGCRVLPVFP
jgi:hypothetical protein